MAGHSNMVAEQHHTAGRRKIMNILFIGDIFGRPGRTTVKKLLPEYRKKLKIDLVIANAENSHHGKGVSEKQLDEMRESGVDFFTSGNHVWKVREIIARMNDEDLPLIRPANYPPGAPGKGYQVVELQISNSKFQISNDGVPLVRDGAKPRKVLIINLMGRVLMSMHLDCPFRTADAILKKFENDKDISAIFVDFHAETTSEKAALGHYLDGRVSAVIGTHTHVPTFDARVLPGGTAFQTDVGFTGPIDSIIGADKKAILENFLTQVPVKHEVAGGDTVFNALKIEINDKTGKAVSVEQIQRMVEQV